MLKKLNKKLFAIIAMVLCLCFAFTACGDEEKPEEGHKHSYNTSEWVSDAEQHWHAASCEHTTEKADVAAHEDENEDEICDVCAYNMHVHAFEEDWTSDVFNHWHAATCGCEDEVKDLAAHEDADENGKCDVCEADIHTCEYNTDEWLYDDESHWYGTTCGHDFKKDEAAHTKNALGICTVCEYGADVEDAIDLGVENKDKVMNGTVTEIDPYDPEAEPSVSEYDFRNGYLYVKNAYGQESYYVVINGAIFAVAANYGDAWLDGGAVLESADGYCFSGGYTGYELEFFGAEDLVSGLYEMGSVDNLNQDFTEDYENGVFSFSFGFYNEYYGLYVYTVSFTIDEETQIIKTVDLNVDFYNKDNIEEVTSATEEAPATWAPKADAEVTTNFNVTVLQSTVKSENYDVENPYDPAKVFVSDFGLTSEMDGAIAESFEIKQGATLTLYITGIAPETANLAFATVTITSDKEGIFTYSYESLIELSTDAEIGTVYTVTVDINGVTKTITLTVIENVPENIIAGTVIDQWGNAEITETDSITMTEGDNTVIGAYLDAKGPTLAVTVNGVAVDAADLLDYSIWLDGSYVSVYAFNARKLAAGTHTVTFACVEYPTLTKTVTVTVEEKAQGGNENVINVTTTDTYAWIDEYTFIATEAGKYTFTVPAGLGVWEKNAYDNYSGEPYIDYQMEPNGGTFTVELAAGETFVFYVGATVRGDWVITYTVEAAASAVINVTTTDTYTWIDEYTFTATEAGKYTFTVPAGLGVWEKNACDNYSGEPYVDYQMEPNGGTFTVELAAGETFAFYVGALTRGDWVITYTVEFGAPVVEAIKDANGLGGEYSFNFVLNYTITVTPSAEGATTGTFTVVDPCYPQYSGTFVYTIVDGAYVFTSENISVTTDGMSWLFQNPGIKIPQAFAEFAIVENPAGSLEIGANQIEAKDVTFAYTAMEAGTLNLSAGNAIMGEVTITYSVNGKDAVALELGTAVDLALAAGDKVVIVVKAKGYSSIQATWTAA